MYLVTRMMGAVLDLALRRSYESRGAKAGWRAAAVYLFAQAAAVGHIADAIPAASRPRRTTEVRSALDSISLRLLETESIAPQLIPARSSEEEGRRQADTRLHSTSRSETVGSGVWLDILPGQPRCSTVPCSHSLCLW